MKFPSLIVMLLAIVLTPGFASADQADVATDALVAKARAQDLAVEKTWLKLGHYRRSSRGGFHSDVVSDTFFLSGQGPGDPVTELEATIRAMTLPLGEAPEQHAQCRFPARYAWLKRRLAWPTDAPTAPCAAFSQWLGHGSITSVSLIFASGNLRNPASYYGHVLLKFNSRENVAANGLLDTSLNYGALVPERENGVVYLARGVAGGYRSSFTHLTFYNHNHRYAETELRNVWEYELALDPWQIELLLAHAWELMGQENRYYFLKQNCAYRMAELANLVVEEPLLPGDKAWAAPIDVFVRLAQAKQNGKPLVARVRRIPSRQTRFREDMEALTPGEQAGVRDFVRVAPKLPLTPVLNRAPVIETLIDYYTFIEVKSAAKGPEATRIKDQLLLARLRLPAKLGQAEAPSPPAPHLGQRSTMGQISAVTNDRRGDSVEMRLRGAHHDFLTYAPGLPPNSELTLVDLRLAARRSGVVLREFEFARITTLNLSETGLPKDGARAWRLRFGAEPRDLGCDGCMVGYAEGGLGKGVALGRSAAAYVFLNGRVNLGDNGGAYLLSGPTMGLLFGPGRAWRAKLEAGAWQELDGRHRTRPSLALDTRFGGAARWDVRVGVRAERLDQHTVVESRLGLARFW